MPRAWNSATLKKQLHYPARGQLVADNDCHEVIEDPHRRAGSRTDVGDDLDIQIRGRHQAASFALAGLPLAGRTPVARNDHVSLPFEVSEVPST